MIFQLQTNGVMANSFLEVTDTKTFKAFNQIVCFFSLIGDTEGSFYEDTKENEESGRHDYFLIDDYPSGWTFIGIIIEGEILWKQKYYTKELDNFKIA